MTDHLSTETIARFTARDLSAAELFAAGDHFAACDECRRRLNEAERSFAVAADLQADLRAAAPDHPLDHRAGHLADDQFVALWRGRVDDVEREIVESHLEICAQCAEIVSDLRAMSFQESTEPRPTEPRQPELQMSFWQRLAAWFRSSPFALPLQAAVTVALALIFAWLATMPLNREIDRLQAQNNDLHQVNDELQRQVAALGSGSSGSQSNVGVQAPLNDGGRMVRLDRQGNLTGLEALSPAHQQIVQQALLKERVELARLPSELSPRTGPLLGAQAPGVAFALLSPVGIVVETARPTFRWRPLSGAASYNVKIYDANLQTVAQSGPLATTSWTVPKSLARGQVYGWSVSALKDGAEITSPAPPAPEAKFQTLDQAKVEEIKRARRDFGDSRIVLGLLYANAGLRAEAEREFRALAQANPDSPVAQKLWRSLSAR